MTRQDIDEEGRLPSSCVPPPLEPVGEPQSVVEATALLAQFRPFRMSIESMKKLLEARADPNITLPETLHPLMNVYAFAPADKIVEFRDILLTAGAIEDKEMKERWVIRRRADASEGAWMRRCHGDDRVGASMAYEPCEA